MYRELQEKARNEITFKSRKNMQRPRRVFPPGSLSLYQPMSILLDVGTFSSYLGIVRVRTPSLYSPVMSSVLTDETSKLLLNEP